MRQSACTVSLCLSHALHIVSNVTTACTCNIIYYRLFTGICGFYVTARRDVQARVLRAGGVANRLCRVVAIAVVVAAVAAVAAA